MGNGYFELPGTATNYSRVAAISAYNPSTSMRVDFRGASDDWSRAADEQAVVAQWAGANLNWLFRLKTDGKLEFFYSGSSRATSSSATTLTDGVSGWLRVDVTFGAGTGVITFYESTTNTLDPDSVSYSQISTHTGLTIAAVAHNANLDMGTQGTSSNNDPFDGKFERVRMQVDGTTQLNVDFTNITSAECTAGSFPEDSPNVATVILTNGTCVADTLSGQSLRRRRVNKIRAQQSHINYQ